MVISIGRSGITKPENDIFKRLVDIFFFTLAFLPLYASCLPFAVLELTKLLAIPLPNNMLVVLLAMSLISLASYQTSKVFADLFFKSEHPSVGHIPLLIDVIICFGVISLILMRFYSYHYVAPSGSVQYYIFYDYVRLFHQTGFYRPDLPIENPAGTWHSMLTYNPSIGALLSLTSLDNKFESFYQSFGLITGFFNVGLIVASGFISRQALGLYSVGALSSLLLLFFSSDGLALMQLMNTIGAHDTPTLYFCTISVCLFIMLVNKQQSLESHSQITILAFITLVAFLGASIRPYLLSLFLGLCTFNFWRFRELLSIAKLKHFFTLVFSDKTLIKLVFFITFILTVSMVWFVIIFTNYGQMVIYSHSTHLSKLSPNLQFFSSQLEVLFKVLTNRDGLYSFAPSFSYLPGVMFSFFIVGTSFFNVNSRAKLPIIVLASTTILFPLILKLSLHWKIYIPFVFIISNVLPIVLVSNFAELFRKKLLILSAGLVITLVCTSTLIDRSVLPNANTLKPLEHDRPFREKISKLHQKYGGKILVLRGGEPGGDSQTNIKNYYYWDNIFLFGDIDSFFIENEATSESFTCMLKKRGVTLIFEPETIGIPNHSGENIYGKVKKLIHEETNIFLTEVERNDGYNGLLHRINYEKICN